MVRPTLGRALRGAEAGLVLGAAFTLLLGVLAVIERSRFVELRGQQVDLLRAAMSYLIGGPMAGFIGGALARFTRRILGAAAVGAVAGFPCCWLMASAVVSAPQYTWVVAIVGSIWLGGTLGVVCAHMLREPEPNQS
jgi:hypothetical protein